MVSRPLFLALSLLIAACASEPEHAPLTRSLADENRCCELRVPDTWRQRNDLHPLAELQIADAHGHVLLISEARSSLPGMDLTEFSKLTREALLESLEAGRVTAGPEPVQIDERDGIRYELSGEVDGRPVSYLHTVLGGEERYYQLLAWSDSSQYPELRPLLAGITGSFRALAR